MSSSNCIRSQERHDPTSSGHNLESESDTAQTGNAGDDVALYSSIKCYWNIVRVLDQSSSFKRGIAWQTLISRHHRCLVRRPQYPIPTTLHHGQQQRPKCPIGQLQSEGLRPIKLAKQRSWVSWSLTFLFWS
jgi:hypothetical protein